jgi:hypothetical protein
LPGVFLQKVLTVDEQHVRLSILCALAVREQRTARKRDWSVVNNPTDSPMN